MVTDVERDYLWSTYANDPRARINLGIRRRLASLMDNDRRKIELMNSLLFSFPGTPIIYYGDEIGMGDNIYLGDRNGVRTPMQWTSDRNGGFSRCDPARLFLPVIMDPGLRTPVRQRRSPAAQPLLVPELDEAADRRAALQQRVQPRHPELHPAGEPHRAGLCPAIRERHHRMCRQPVALGAGRRNRSQPLEGPRAAGDARAGRRFRASATALSRHARRPTASSGSCSAISPSRSRDRSRARARPSRWCGRTIGIRRSRIRERHAFEHDVLPHFLLERRWFADKARGLPTAKLRDRHSAGTRRRQRRARVCRRSRRAAGRRRAICFR